jgi:hypothetical protein
VTVRERRGDDEGTAIHGTEWDGSACMARYGLRLLPDARQARHQAAA